MKTVTTLYNKHLGNLLADGWREPQNPQLAQIFAAAMTGVSLAARAGAIELSLDKAQKRLQQIFSHWCDYERKMARLQQGNTEEIRNLSIMIMQKNSHLFLDPNKSVTPDDGVMGYVKRNNSYSYKVDEYYIFPSVFREKFCTIFDEEEVKEVLHELGWLAKDLDNRWQFLLYGRDPKTGKRKSLGRFYKLMDVATPGIMQERLSKSGATK
jgi:ORF562 (fragment)